MGFGKKATYVIDVNLLHGLYMADTYMLCCPKIINGVMWYGYALLNKIELYNETTVWDYVSGGMW